MIAMNKEIAVQSGAVATAYLIAKSKTLKLHEAFHNLSICLILEYALVFKY